MSPRETIRSLREQAMAVRTACLLIGEGLIGYATSCETIAMISHHPQELGFHLINLGFFAVGCLGIIASHRYKKRAERLERLQLKQKEVAFLKRLGPTVILYPNEE